MYTKDKAAGTLDVTSFSLDNDQSAVESAAKMKKSQQKGDFIFKYVFFPAWIQSDCDVEFHLRIDDMLAVLFPHMFEDVEYLIGEDAANGISNDIEMADGTTVNGSAEMSPPINGASKSSPNGRENAVAGPSRLPR